VKVVCTVLRGGRRIYLKPPPLPDRWAIGEGMAEMFSVRIQMVLREKPYGFWAFCFGKSMIGSMWL
jgi:hypothetical protein